MTRTAYGHLVPILVALILIGLVVLGTAFRGAV